MNSSYSDILTRIAAALDAARPVFTPFTPGAVATEDKAGHDRVTEEDRAVDATRRAIQAQNAPRNKIYYSGQRKAQSPRLGSWETIAQHAF